jgi:hypothetical protein
MSTDARRPDKSDGTTDDTDRLTMAQLENALHQRPLVIDCRACGGDATLTRDSLYHIAHIARIYCTEGDCSWGDLVPHEWLLKNLSLPDDLEVEQ